MNSISEGWLDYLKIGEQVPHPKIWEQLLGEWCSVMNDYARQCEARNDYIKSCGGDLPYWHQKERSNLGFVAGAVWRLGGVTLQEFEVTRGPGTFPADLWFRINDLQCHVEAKGVDPSTPSHDVVEQQLGEAVEQLAIADNEKTDIGIALCFVAPAVTGQSFDFRELVRSFEGKDSFVAVYLAGQVNVAYEGYRYPGIALIGRVIWRQPATVL